MSWTFWFQDCRNRWVWRSFYVRKGAGESLSCECFEAQILPHYSTLGEFTSECWSKAEGSMDVELPVRDSIWLIPAFEKSCPTSPSFGVPSLYKSSSPRIDSGPRELVGVGMGVAAVRIIIGGAVVPQASMWPLAVISSSTKIGIKFSSSLVGFYIQT